MELTTRRALGASRAMLTRAIIACLLLTTVALSAQSEAPTYPNPTGLNETTVTVQNKPTELPTTFSQTPAAHIPSESYSNGSVPTLPDATNVNDTSPGYTTYKDLSSEPPKPTIPETYYTTLETTSATSPTNVTSSKESTTSPFETTVDLSTTTVPVTQASSPITNVSHDTNSTASSSTVPSNESSTADVTGGTNETKMTTLPPEVTEIQNATHESTTSATTNASENTNASTTPLDSTSQGTPKPDDSSTTVQESKTSTSSSSVSKPSSPDVSTTGSPISYKDDEVKALSSGSVAAITIIVIAIVLAIFGVVAYWKIRHSSYGRLLEEQDYGSLGNYNNPLYDDS